MQRKKKRSIIFELHSIPIKLRSLWTNIHNNSIPHNKKYISNSKRLYLVSYSIPLSCMVVLLLGSVMLVNPSLFENDKSYAVEVEEDTANNEANNDIGIDIEEANDVMPLANGSSTSGSESATEPDDSDSSSPTASLTVGGDALDKTVEVGINEVAYRHHTISVNVSDMMDYYLVLAGDPNLTLQDKTPTHTIPTLTSNSVGSSLPENRWGFAWEKDGSTSVDALTYKPITSSNTTLESNSSLAEGSTVSFNGQLNFAAKFGESTVLGKYSSKVSLSLIATPKTVSTAAKWVNTSGQAIGAGVDSGMMQDIPSDFCSNSAVLENYTITLKDARDGNNYKIVKLKDKKCWMQQNLRLTAKSDDGLALTSKDTNISGMWILPRTLVGSGTTVLGWVDSNTTPYSATFNNTEYGTYYNWCAATAGICSDTTTDMVNASGSICPKGWHMPSGGGTDVNGHGTATGEYSVFVGLNQDNIQQAPYLFPAASFITGGSFDKITSSISNGGGLYWSSTANDADIAYSLYFEWVPNFYPGTYKRSKRYYGASVRCVADY